MKNNAVIVETETFAETAADFIVGHINKAIKERGKCVLALSGGSTPKEVYMVLVRRKAVQWNNVLFTWSDERCVPPTSEESNFYQANTLLLQPLGILPQQIMRMEGEIDPEKAAEKYEGILSGIAGGLEHDLLLLGIGGDGHTASLFPGTKALDETQRLVVANFVPQQNTFRLTMTFPLINASRNVCFLVNDPKKKEVLNAILSGDVLYPAARVTAKESITWIIGK